MTLTDTHAHIYAPEFNNEIREIIAKANEAGVKKIFMPNINIETINPMMKLAQEYPEKCFPMMGIHPTYIKENYCEELKIAEEYIKKEKIYAIGETGIDLYWDKTYKKEQQEAFDIQIKWALKYKLPLIIHSRESFDQIFETLKPYQNQKLQGIFHSFSGNITQAEKIIQMGFLIGVNGIITFKNSELHKTISKIDIKHLVIETDSPYLAPAPKRGKRNESSYLKYIAEKLADTHNVTLEEIAIKTTQNAKELFKI